MRVRVKVCGITRLEDAEAAVDLGADALGFNFVPGSPRAVPVETARRILESLPSWVVGVGVVADRPAASLERLARDAGVAVLQLHGDETPEACRAIPVPWYKALRVSASFRPEDVARYARHGESRATVLLDGSVPGMLGGTGRAFDWEVARRAGEHGRIIVAGGLGPDSVAAAIRAARPFGVDVNSGVESSPGVKDRALLARLLREVARAAEAS